MKLTEIILEARKQHKKNVKVSINSQIEEHYYKAPLLEHLIRNSFVSFTKLDKLGVNPSSRYKTPYGIYCYPSFYILNSTSENGGSSLSMNNLPFAGGQPYGNIFSIKGNILYIDKMTITEYNLYINKLRDIITTRYSDYPELDKLLSRAIDRAPSNADHSTIIGGQFWYIMWSISNSIASETHKSKGPIIWNVLFRLLGIDAVIDKGIGIIHSSEPTQAVVFNLRNITNITRVKNAYSPETMLQQKLLGKMVNDTISNIDNTTEDDILAIYYKGQHNILKYVKDPVMISKLLQNDPFMLKHIKHPTTKQLKTVIGNDLELLIRIVRIIPSCKHLATEELVIDLINKQNFIPIHRCRDLCEEFPQYEEMLYALVGKNKSMVLHSSDIMNKDQAAKVKQYAEDHNLNYS